MKLPNKKIFITGGAKRLGMHLALALAERGADIVFTYRSSSREAQNTLNKLRDLGSDALALKTDLTKPAEIKRAFKQAAKHYGKLDVLINSAANFQPTPFKTLSEKDWDFAMDTNAKAPYLCALEAAKIMRRGGKIINFADWAGNRPYKGYLPYCISKAAILALTQGLAHELAPRIAVTAVAPGPVLPGEKMSAAARKKSAEQALLKKWGKPEDVVNSVLFMLEGTDYMTGTTIYVDGGKLIA